MTITLRMTAFAIASLGLAGCPPTSDPGPAEEEPTVQLAPEQAAEARRTIVRWLECEECNAGELASVVRLGAVAVPTLSATLLQGPSPARLEEERIGLVELYRRQVEYAQTHPAARPTMSEAEYIDLYTGNLLALYQTRSALALEQIGGEAAASALERALRQDLRDDVRAVVAAAARNVRR